MPLPKILASRLVASLPEESEDMLFLQSKMCLLINDDKNLFTSTYKHFQGSYRNRAIKFNDFSMTFS